MDRIAVQRRRVGVTQELSMAPRQSFSSQWPGKGTHRFDNRVKIVTDDSIFMSVNHGAKMLEGYKYISPGGGRGVALQAMEQAWIGGPPCP